MASTPASTFAPPDEHDILAVRSWRMLIALDRHKRILQSDMLGHGDPKHIWGIMQSYGLGAAVLISGHGFHPPIYIIVSKGGIGVRDDTLRLDVELKNYKVFPTLEAAETYLTMRADYYAQFVTSAPGVLHDGNGLVTAASLITLD